MASRFPPAVGSEEPAIDPRRRAGTERLGDEGRVRRAPIFVAAIILIAGGAALLSTVTGTIAGVDADAIGVAAIMLGGIALIIGLAALRSSRRRNRPSVP
jgi:hypothetical protein